MRGSDITGPRRNLFGEEEDAPNLGDEEFRPLESGRGRSRQGSTASAFLVPGAYQSSSSNMNNVGFQSDRPRERSTSRRSVRSESKGRVEDTREPVEWPDKPHLEGNAEYKDKWAGFIFYIQFILVSSLGFVIMLSHGNTPNFHIPPWLVLAGCFGAVLSMTFLKLLKTQGTLFILLAHALSTLISAVLVVVCFAHGFKAMAIVLLSVTIGSLVFLVMARHRIPFAGLVLENAARVIDQHPSTVVVAFGALFVFLIYSLLWGYVVATAYHVRGGDNYFAIFIMLVLYYWTAQVAHNVVVTTASGAVAIWYLSPAQGAAIENPAKEALKRALTNQFGSICFGSLLTAILSALRTTLRALRPRDGTSVVWRILQYILEWVEGLMSYFNAYAYVHIALYSNSYFRAAQNTWKLMKCAGLIAVINDLLVGRVLIALCFLGGLIVGTICGLWAGEGSVLFLGCACGWVVTSITMSVVAAAVNATFVCYAEHPERLFATNPELYEKLLRPYIPEDDEELV